MSRSLPAICSSAKAAPVAANERCCIRAREEQRCAANDCAKHALPVTFDLSISRISRRNADPMTIVSHTKPCLAQDVCVQGAGMHAANRVGKCFMAVTAFIGGCATR